MKNTVLLIVDVQNSLIKDNPYGKNLMLENITSLINLCRKKSVEIIYVRHNDPEDEDFKLNSPGWNIYRDIAPEQKDMIFDKCYNSAFKDTGLKNYLDSQGIKNIILVGMQTEYCIDATCKIAFEYGYNILLPENSITTFDSDFLTADKLNKFYYEEIWNDRYGKVIPLSDVEKCL